MVGVVRVTYLLRKAEITSGSSFEPNNPTEQKLGYESDLEKKMCENDLEKKTRTLKSLIKVSTEWTTLWGECERIY